MKSILRLLAALLAVSSVAAPPAPLPDDPACTEQDRTFMRRANELARVAITRGNSAYGALLVRNGEILLEFSNDAVTSRDVTHHAETGLISLASVKLGRAALADTILYTSTEPCIMCCGSIRAAGIKTFVYGVTATQVSVLRNRPLPAKPLECREVFVRTGSPEVVIRGPLLEAEGLEIHRAALPPSQASR